MIRIAVINLLIFGSLNAGMLAKNTDNVSRVPETIHWDSINRLKWDDFKGKAEMQNSISALTASAIEYSYDCDYDGSVDMEIRALFFPKDSWVKPFAKKDYVLAHEQLHFDITELYARKLRKTVSMRIQTCRDLKQLEGLADEVIDEWKATQKLYDRETHHSINEDKQNAWEQKIRAELLKYEAYGPDFRFSDN